MRVIAPLLCLATHHACHHGLAAGDGLRFRAPSRISDPSPAFFPGAPTSFVEAGTKQESTSPLSPPSRHLLDPGDADSRYATPSPSRYRGSKRVALSDIRLTTATAAQVNVKLELGQLSETVTVTSGTEAVVQTQTNTLGSHTLSRPNRLPSCCCLSRVIPSGARCLSLRVFDTPMTGPARLDASTGLPSGAIYIS